MPRNDEKIRVTAWIKGDVYDMMHAHSNLVGVTHQELIERAVRWYVESVVVAKVPARVVVVPRIARQA